MNSTNMISSSEDGVTISRAMPSILEEHMPTSYWNNFCNELDEVLKPVVEVKQLLGWCTYINFADFALSIVFIALVFSRVVSNGLWWGLLGGTWGISILAQCYLLRKVHLIIENILKGMEEVCSRANQRYPEIELKVRASEEFSQRVGWTCNPGAFFDNLDYIEVSIKPAEP